MNILFVMIYNWIKTNEKKRNFMMIYVSTNEYMKKINNSNGVRIMNSNCVSCVQTIFQFNQMHLNRKF